MPVINLPHIKTIRCSSLDTLHRCGPSVLGDNLMRVGRDYGMAADQGKAVHARLEGSVFNDSFSAGTDAWYSSNGITEPDDMAECRKLIGYGWNKWKEFKVHMPKPKTEQSFNFNLGCKITLTGTIDVHYISDDKKTVIFIDWKSGRLNYGHRHQMAGYATLIRKGYLLSDDVTVKGIVVYLREGRYRVDDYTAKDSADWVENLERNVLSEPSATTFRTGDYCRFCECATSCEALKKRTEATFQTMLFGDNYQKQRDLLNNLTSTTKYKGEVGQAIEDIMFRIRIAEQAVVDTRVLLKDTIEKVGGIPLPDETVLRLTERRRDTILPEKAWGILQKELALDEIKQVVSISKIRLLKAVRHQHRAEKQQEKNDHVLRVLKALDDAGAITTTTSQVMEIVDMSKLDLKKTEKEQSHE